MESKLKFAQMDQAGESPTVAKPGQVYATDGINVSWVAAPVALSESETIAEMNVVVNGLNNQLWGAQERISELESVIKSMKRKGYEVAPVAAVPAEPSALQELLTRIDDAWSSYERTGEICQFEGEPMIYASTLEEIHALSQSVDTPTIPAPVEKADEPQYQEDPVDILRSLCCAVDRQLERGEHYPSPTSQNSPIMIAARRACVERGFTAGGLALTTQPGERNV